MKNKPFTKRNGHTTGKKVKCHHCGKFTYSPYRHTTVPPHNMYMDPKPYVKKAEKTNRVDLIGNLKVTVNNYCNVECWQEVRSRK